MTATNGRRDEDVVITTRDIYTLAADTAGKVDAVLAMMTNHQNTATDHEARLRRLEARFFGIVGTMGLAAATLVAYVLSNLTGSN